MLTFHRFLIESSPSSSGGITTMSLDDFLKDPSAGTPTSAPLDVAEADEFAGAKVQPMPDEQMQQYLQRVFTKTKDTKDRFLKPHVHSSLLQKVGGQTVGGKTYLLAPHSDVAIDATGGEIIDADALKKAIMTRPPQLLVTGNEKMAKSGGDKAHFVAFGIPALLGLAVNEKTNEFMIVRTCPGAGQCQMYCYAMDGNFIRYKDVNLKQMRILNFLVNDPQGFFRAMGQEITKLKTSMAAKGKQLYIRWHDSGDFFSSEYKKYFYDMVGQHTDVEFYAYTKMAHVANDTAHPDNLVVNFSQGAKPEQVKQVDMTTTKHSVVVPSALFSDILKRQKGTGYVLTPDILKTLKQRLAAEYDVPENTILSYDEMMKTPYNPKNKLKWNVIILPGADGDVSAARRDVRITFLLIH